jgi:hypothetical protein
MPRRQRKEVGERCKGIPIRRKSKRKVRQAL